MEEKSTQGIKTLIDQKLTESLFKNAPLSYSMQTALAILVYVLLQDHLDNFYLSVWMFSLILITLLRVIIVGLFWDCHRQSENTNYYKNIYLILLCLNALVWGLLIFIPKISLMKGIVSFISFVIAGVSAGALMTLSPLLLAAIPFLLGMLLPFMFYMVNQEQTTYLAMGLMSGLYLMLLIKTSIDINKMLRTSHQVDLENNNLFQFLKNAKERADNKLKLYEGILSQLDEETKLEHAFFENTEDMIIILNTDMKIKTINPAFHQFSGLERFNCEEVSFYTLTHMDDIDILKKQISHILTDHITSRFNIRLKNKKDQYINCDINVVYVAHTLHCSIRSIYEPIV